MVNRLGMSNPKTEWHFFSLRGMVTHINVFIIGFWASQKQKREEKIKIKWGLSPDVCLCWSGESN